MSSGDDALWNHADGSRGPRVFDGALGGATCVGKFRRIDWYVIDAPRQAQARFARSECVLRPVDVEPVGPRGSESVRAKVRANETRVDVVSIEENTEGTYMVPSRDTDIIEQTESEVARAFAAKARRRGCCLRSARTSGTS